MMDFDSKAKLEVELKSSCIILSWICFILAISACFQCNPKGMFQNMFQSVLGKSEQRRYKYKKRQGMSN